MANVRGTGWIPDLPDDRDLTPESDRIRSQILSFGTPLVRPKVDLRTTQSFPPIVNQGGLQSCTAHAAVCLLEYFETQAFKTYIEHSRLFVYKVTRNLALQSADVGAFLRDTMKALALVGAPPEQYWPYVEASVNVEPTPFAYALAQNFQALDYYRYDPDGADRAVVLQKIQTNLSSGLPAMFGFYLFQDAVQQAERGGTFPVPSQEDRPIGGHAVVAVGYDNGKRIKNVTTGEETEGAILFRNSWGPAWGDRGYGWLPYEYVTRELAVDWWSLISSEFVNTNQFGFGLTA